MSAVALLRERINLEAPSRTPDAMGGATTTYQAQGAVFAQIEPLGLRAAEDLGGAAAVLGYRGAVRAGLALGKGWRIAWRGRRLLVTAVLAPDADGLVRFHAEEEIR